MVQTNNTIFSFASQRLATWIGTGRPFGKTCASWIDLTDMLGRVISNIYTGNSEGLNHPFTLPELSTGLYIVNISLNDTKLPAQKLIINQ